MQTKFYSSKTFLITISVIFVLFIGIVLPFFASLTEEKTNSNFSPDTGFFYTIDQFYENMEIYNESGRNFYILMRWTFDIIWPLVYFSFFISCLSYLSLKYERKRRLFIFSLPILGLGFDIIENILATINVAIYPNRAVYLVKFLQIASILKWIFIALTFFVIIYLIFANIIFKKKISSS